MEYSKSEFSGTEQKANYFLLANRQLPSFVYFIYSDPLESFYYIKVKNSIGVSCLPPNLPGQNIWVDLKINFCQTVNTILWKKEYEKSEKLQNYKTS